MDNKVNECVVCGLDIPEGDHICTNCKKLVSEPRKEITEETAETVRAAVAHIKDYCLNRILKTKEGCKCCPIKDICYNEPYLWEV